MATDKVAKQGIEGLAQKVEEKWKNSRLLIKGEELEFKTTERGTIAQVVSSSLGFANGQIGSFIREIPVGWKSGKHKHNMEAIIHFLQGKGYTVIDGVKYEWKKGDTMTVPPMAVHQHFNTSKEEPGRFLAVTTIPMMVNIGSFVAEQMENAAKLD